VKNLSRKQLQNFLKQIAIVKSTEKGLGKKFKSHFDQIWAVKRKQII